MTAFLDAGMVACSFEPADCMWCAVINVYSIYYRMSGGVELLLKCIDDRLARQPMSELDQSLLLELLGCCKQTMNNDIGMSVFLSFDRAVERLTQTLIALDCKPLALLVRVLDRLLPTLVANSLSYLLVHGNLVGMQFLLELGHKVGAVRHPSVGTN
jgi:hypothetical protein